MSLDLKMIPLECDRDDWGFGHSLLSCGAGSVWHERLKNIPRTPVPKDFGTYVSRMKTDSGDGPQYGNTQQTPYGEPLECVTVGQIVDSSGSRDFGTKDLAVLAYLRILPRDMRVALYWH
jgi:hypothetical protein